jgi:translation initiation factor IF-2
MTQHIGASFFPVETLKQLIGPYMGTFKTGIEIPGLLIVDVTLGAMASLMKPRDREA